MKKVHQTSRNVNTALERLFEVSGLLSDASGSQLAAEGLTTARAEVIWRIGRAGPLTQRQLSDAMRCSPRNVTGLVDALEDQALVSRQPHPTDRRALLVTLTPQGQDAARRWDAGYRTLGQQLFGDMRDADLHDFIAALDHVLQRLHTLERDA